MPQDYRRFNGPEDSIPFHRFIKDYVKGYDELHKELLNEEGKRKDGRSLDEARSTCMFFSRTDMVSQAKGSSYVEMSKTKVVCSVFDPREIPHQNDFSQLGQIFCEVKFAPFSCKGERKSPVPDAEEKALSVALKQALEPSVCRNLFPNFQIDIFVYILENDGACLAAAINAAGLALCNAAVPMYDIITSCSLAIIGDQVFIDPTYQEESLALANTDANINHGTVTMSMLPVLKQITDYRQVGSMDMQCVMNSLDSLEKECYEVVPNIQQAIVRNVVYNFDQRKQLDEEAKLREQIMNAMVEKWKGILNDG